MTYALAWHRGWALAQVGTRLLAVVVLSMASLGCGVSSKGEDGTCRLMASPHQRPSPLQEEVCGEVMESQRTLLDFYFGRYLSGEVPVYRGHADGQDNATAIGMPAGHMTGDAIAVLLPHETEVGQTLDVFTVPEGLHMTVRNEGTDPGTLTLAHVMDRWTSGGGALVSSGSVALSPAPDRLDFSLMSTGEWGNAAPFTATLTATLNRMDAAEMTPAEAFLLVPERSLEDFTPLNHELVRGLEDTWVSTVETHPRTGLARCLRLTPYSLQQYVNVDTIADHGVRNVTLGPSQVCCSALPCQSAEGGCPPLDQCFDD